MKNKIILSAVLNANDAVVQTVKCGTTDSAVLPMQHTQILWDPANAHTIWATTFYLVTCLGEKHVATHAPKSLGLGPHGS